ncbi:TPA: hypothetical protein EYN98_17235 [Candidatus Poribacteria bacterium]|nr:hypothetical protein [Candidatus Poribacteria bacterium]HIA67762.1 hypothetical protein [Candidatus Poribacteria bacterium]HIB92022.1 hypothetical protein [Candidatus Poribacteria bacterium]HIB99267.1 hypothetical protein [Candidatus Poribacteria bacterium]HIM12025.1 hypothetical protein [Candidatus Poribacteria bacterium]
MNLDPCREIFFRCDRIDLMEKTDEELLFQLQQLQNCRNLTNNDLLELEILRKWYDYRSWIASPETHQEKKQQSVQLQIPT